MQETYPHMVDVPAGGPPALASGQKATGFPSDYSMSVDVGEGRHALVESITPIALETEDGGHTPLDLGLHEAGGGFQPMAGLAHVFLPKDVSEGASLVDRGVSLTPVTEQGTPLGGQGAADHAGVFYGVAASPQAGIQDLGMLAKPTTEGFEWYSTLFSARSPEHLFFKVGLPEGATLEQGESREVRVMREGQAIAIVSAFTAQDAEGTPVPVTMSLASADTIELTVARKPGQFRYPLVVDPTMDDTTFLAYLSPAWIPCASGLAKCPEGFAGSKFGLGEFGGGYEAIVQGEGLAPKNGEWGDYQYETQGNSKIYELETETLERDYFTESETLLEAFAGSKQENWGLLANNVETSRFGAAICAIKTTTCEPSQGANKNLVEFVKRITAEGAGRFEDRLYLAHVWISQTESPTITFNTTSPTIEVKEPNGTIVNRNNVLYPSNKEWIGPFTSTAFEMTAKDPGVGVSFAVADGNTWSRETFLMTTEKDCKGVQCPQEFKGKYTYFTTTPGFTTPMPSGEYSIQGRAENALKMAGEKNVTIRVDALGPQGIKLTNLPAGGQIGEGVFKLKAEATDGKTGEPSSGVASLKLGIDGAEAGEPNGSCTSGPCTATGEWTINGGLLSAGPHTLTVLATDKAGNVEHQDFTVYVHHAAPVSVGPGSLDPQSGNFSMAATDASLGSGLSISRSYSSRDLTAGVEGGLGPQWLGTLGSAEELEELSNGDMVLRAPNGGTAVFLLNAKEEFEAPTGDVNLSLTPEVNEQKVPVGYTLKDSAAGTSTLFARAENYLQSAPIYYGEVGWQGPSTGQLVVPTGVTADSKGDVWVLDQKSSHVEKFDPQGEYVSQFGYESSSVGGFKQPDSIAIDSKGNLWIADTGNNRIEEFTEGGSYLRKAGTEGTGTLKAPQGIAVDASNNVWVTDTGDNRVVEFNETGGYVRETVKTVGSLALSEPIGVATDKSGDAWVTDAKNHRVVEFGPTGSALKEYGSSGSTNGKFETPTGIAIDSEGNMWVADSVLNRVQEFNIKGEYLTQVGSTGSNQGQLKKPDFLAIDGRGELLVADTENARVGRWAHSTWTAATSQGASATSTVTYKFKTVLIKGGTVTHPVEVVAPHPAELSCTPTVNKGCRVLFLKYAATTTATGEGEGEWKDYEGRLKEVVFAAWNPTSTKVEEKAVVQYAYDTQGRLRAEWDPRITPNLKTVYGYDVEGHVTTVSPPGQEPWLIHYGTIPTDGSAGRLLAVTRPAATTEPGTRLAPKNTALPTLSTSTPAVGVRISVSSNGTWSNTPLAYSYQWEDCNSSGGECAVISWCSQRRLLPGAQRRKTQAGGLGHRCQCRRKHDHCHDRDRPRGRWHAYQSGA